MKQKCLDYLEKLPFMVIFLYNLYIFVLIQHETKMCRLYRKITIYGHFSIYNLYIFVWIQHECLASTVFALDPSNSVTRRWMCTCICLFHHQKMMMFSIEPIML